jgi:hypothetical protein
MSHKNSFSPLYFKVVLNDLDFVNVDACLYKTSRSKYICFLGLFLSANDFAVFSCKESDRSVLKVYNKPAYYNKYFSNHINHFIV